MSGSDSTTPLLGLTQPAINASENTWGGKLNHDLDILDSALNAALPVGTVVAFAGQTIPTGWLLCDGRAVSRITYGTLFANVGGYYGEGDGNTTFNLPNLQACYIVGTGTGTDAAGHTQSYLLGQAAGYYQILIGQANLPNYQLSCDTSGAHVHNMAGVTLPNLPPEQDGYSGVLVQDGPGYIGSSGAHIHNIWLGGGGVGLDVTQPTVILNRIIFAGIQTVMNTLNPSALRRVTPMRGSR